MKFALISALLAGLCWQPSSAQNLPATNSHCPAPEAIQPAHLYGQWQLRLGSPESLREQGEVVFERHPEFAGSVRGTLTRQEHGRAIKAQVAGDVTHQGFQLEESADGVSIDAVWSGDVTPMSCGKEIKGWRRVTEGNSAQEAVSEQPFVLSKTPGWR